VFAGWMAVEREAGFGKGEAGRKRAGRMRSWRRGEKRRFLDGSADELTRGVRRLDGCGEGGWLWQRGGRKNACRKEEELEKRRDGSRTVAPTS